MAPPLEKIALFAGIAALAVTVNVNLPLHLDHVDTPSMKMGWYWITPGATVDRGDVVTACPPSRYARWAYEARILGAGPCDGIERITKRVVVVAGDRVRIDDSGVFVNGQYQADSKPRPLYQEPVGFG
jgi:type IV secretory pathway protease TraF